MEEAKFFYEVTFNGKLILVAQSIKDQKYIDLRANVTFVEEDNKRLATVPGGLDGVQRVMRLFLALMHIGYTGFEIPFKTLGVFRRLPITQDFSEEKFIDAFFSVEAALNLIGVVISTPPQEAKPPSQ